MFQNVCKPIRMKRDELSAVEIGNRIKQGVNFTVRSERERKKALTAAQYIGATIHTRKVNTGFYIYFLADMPETSK